MISGLRAMFIKGAVSWLRSLTVFGLTVIDTFPLIWIFWTAPSAGEQNWPMLEPRLSDTSRETLSLQGLSGTDWCRFLEGDVRSSVVWSGTWSSQENWWSATGRLDSMTGIMRGVPLTERAEKSDSKQRRWKEKWSIWWVIINMVQLRLWLHDDLKLTINILFC